MAGVYDVERRLREELAAVRETRIALERLGLLDLEKAVELEREEARIRMMLYELERERGWKRCLRGCGGWSTAA